MASDSTHSSNYDQDTPLDEDSSSSENSTGENIAHPKGLSQAIASRVAEHERRSKRNQDRRPITRSIASQSVPKTHAAGVKRRRKVSSSKSDNTSSASATAPSMDSCPSTGGATDPTTANMTPVVPDPHHRLMEELQKEASYLIHSIRAATSRLDSIQSLIHDLSKTDVPVDW